MIIIKTKETQELDTIIKLLAEKPVMELVIIEQSYISGGMLFYNKDTTRYVRCSSLRQCEGIVLELGTLDEPELSNVVMSPMSNRDTQKAADQIYTWFTVDDGKLFDVDATSLLPACEVARVGGKLKRYKLSGS